MDIKLVRIIGNSLPFRDKDKIKALQYVLNHEWVPSGVPKIWILNQLRPCSESDKIRQILYEHNQSIIEIPFDAEMYKKAKTRKEKILAFIGINRARNYALNHLKNYDWLFLLDDTNYFSGQAWLGTVKGLEGAVARTPGLKACAIPIARHVGSLTTDPFNLPLNEPVIGFHSTAKVRFDESVCFGNGEKVELLKRLGGETKEVSEKNYQTMCHPDSEICPQVGRVLHVSFSDSALESDEGVNRRIEARKQGIDEVISKLDIKYLNE